MQEWYAKASHLLKVTVESYFLTSRMSDASRPSLLTQSTKYEHFQVFWQIHLCPWHLKSLLIKLFLCFSAVLLVWVLLREDPLPERFLVWNWQRNLTFFFFFFPDSELWQQCRYASVSFLMAFAWWEVTLFDSGNVEAPLSSLFLNSFQQHTVYKKMLFPNYTCLSWIAPGGYLLISTWNEPDIKDYLS